MTRATLERLLQEYLQATGDILYAAGAGTIRRVARLGIGGAGNVLTVAGGVPTWAPAAGGGATEGCRVYHNANQGILIMTVTALAFNQERFDTDGMHDTAINNSRITIQTAGKYLIGGVIEWASGAGGNSVRQILVRRNGIPGDAGFIVANMFMAGGPGSFRVAVNTIWDCAATDYFELCAHHTDATSPLAVVANPTVSPEFWAHRLS